MRGDGDEGPVEPLALLGVVGREGLRMRFEEPNIERRLCGMLRLWCVDGLKEDATRFAYLVVTRRRPLDDLSLSGEKQGPPETEA